MQLHINSIGYKFSNVNNAVATEINTFQSYIECLCLSYLSMCVCIQLAKSCNVEPVLAQTISPQQCNIDIDISCHCRDEHETLGDNTSNVVSPLFLEQLLFCSLTTEFAFRTYTIFPKNQTRFSKISPILCLLSLQKILLFILFVCLFEFILKRIFFIHNN